MTTALTLLISLTTPTLLQTPTDCLALVEAAPDPAGRVEATATALARLACREVETDLLVMRAFALHDIARVDGGDAWCTTRDAYAPLRHVDDPDYARVARDAHDEADAACRGFAATGPRGSDCPIILCPLCPSGPPPGPNPWYFTGSGLGATGIGAVLLGVGVQQYFAATGLRDEIEGATTHARGTGVELRNTENRATTLLTSGGILVGVGVGLLIVGELLDHEAPTTRPAVDTTTDRVLLTIRW